ncbi:MAG: acetyltransferase [Thermoanaerobaculia bacterium]
MNPSGERERIFVFGASGHGKVVIDTLEQQGTYDIAFVADDDPSRSAASFFGYPLAGGRDAMVAMARSAGVRRGIVAIGSNRARRTVAEWLAAAGFGFVAAIHPAAVVGRGVTVGAGSLVVGGAVINPDTRIGLHTIINTASTVDHDCAVGDFVHVAPGAHLCGGVNVGDEVFVCAGATIIPNITVGDGAVIGAGSTVLTNVARATTVVGTPARQR